VQALNRHFVLCAADVLVRELFPEVRPASERTNSPPPTYSSPYRVSYGSLNPPPLQCGAPPEAGLDEEEQGPSREAALEAALRAAVEQVERLSQEVQVLRGAAGASAGAAMGATACTSTSTCAV
jgi:hypothetical protein